MLKPLFHVHSVMHKWSLEQWWINSRATAKSSLNGVDKIAHGFAVQTKPLQKLGRSLGLHERVMAMESALNHSTVHGMNRSRGCMYSTGACCATTSANLSFAAMPNCPVEAKPQASLEPSKACAHALYTALPTKGTVIPDSF